MCLVFLAVVLGGENGGEERRVSNVFFFSGNVSVLFFEKMGGRKRD